VPLFAYLDSGAFKLYALDALLPLPPGAAKAQLEEAMKGHVLGKAELIGLYRRR
jgi:phosphatidylethanolamine-binding protein (PEBP) family uncharacterized protein